VTYPQPGEPRQSYGPYGQAPQHFEQPTLQPGSSAPYPNAVVARQAPSHAPVQWPAQPQPYPVPGVADRRTSAERFWYVIQNIAFGAGYFAKIPAKKAAIEVTGRGSLTGFENFWYVLGCIAFGYMYFAKVPAKKALVEVMTRP